MGLLSQVGIAQLPPCCQWCWSWGICISKACRECQGLGLCMEAAAQWNSQLTWIFSNLKLPRWTWGNRITKVVIKKSGPHKITSCEQKKELKYRREFSQQREIQWKREYLDWDLCYATASGERDKGGAFGVLNKGKFEADETPGPAKLKLSVRTYKGTKHQCLTEWKVKIFQDL